MKIQNYICINFVLILEVLLFEIDAEELGEKICFPSF